MVHEIPEEFEQCLHKANNQASVNQPKDWEPMDFRGRSMNVGVLDKIDRGEKEGIISPGQLVLDMGSGTGSSSLIWAYRGYNVVGIELNKRLYDISQELLSKVKGFLDPDVSVRFLHGSHYSKEYIQLRGMGESKAIAYEEQRLKEMFSRLDVFHPLCKEDLYIKNNIDYADFDIIFSYVWPIQAPSISEMFVLYARHDAVLCSSGIEELGLENINQNGFYRKIKKTYL